MEARYLCQSTEQQQQQCLLRVEAVFGLIEGDGLRAIEHCVGHFSVTSRGQAVHEDRVRRGFGHQRFVHLKGPEDRLSLGGFMLEAHADTDVGVDRIGVFDGRLRVLKQTNLATVDLGDIPRQGHDLDIRRVAAWGGHGDIDA